jgi:hypothetical protein
MGVLPGLAECREGLPRVARRGVDSEFPSYLLSSYCGSLEPEGRNVNYGFRCVLAMKP